MLENKPVMKMLREQTCLILLYLIRRNAAFLILAEHPECLLVGSLLVHVLVQVLHDVAKFLPSIDCYNLYSTSSYECTIIPTWKSKHPVSSSILLIMSRTSISVGFCPARRIAALNNKEGTLDQGSNYHGD